MTNRLRSLAQELVWARDIKDAARLRIQCSLEEWNLVVAEAKHIYSHREH